jgi:hypothetical protein
MKNPKIQLKEVLVGAGTLAEGDVWVKVRTRVFLNHGEEVEGLWDTDGSGTSFRLHDREIIPGLRAAVNGMRVGGHRKVTIPPHLAFRDVGIPGKVPPNAVLRADFELLEVRMPDEPYPVPVEKQGGVSLSIQAWGEESSSMPRWDLIFHDSRHPYRLSKCLLLLEWNTRTDGKWGRRSAQHKKVEIPLAADEVDRLIDVGKRLPIDFASECLHDQVHTHGGYSPSRADSDSVICWAVSSSENSRYMGTFYIRENSPLWTESEWGKRVMGLVSPHLTVAPWRDKKDSHFQ